MKIRSFAHRLAWSFALLAAAGPAFADGPDASLDAVAAVRAQLEALAANDVPTPGAGIARTWDFASPANRRATGPLARFRTLFESPAYEPMLDHVAARISDARQQGDAALVGVVLRAPSGVEYGYLFQLSRQGLAECDGCWLTDSVVPIPVPPAAPTI